MLITEIDTFVRKFHQLWNAGLNAHLDLDCRDGAAYVGLRLELGHPPGPLCHQVSPFHHHRRNFSPSYLRRRARRSAARANIDDTVEVSSSKESENINENDKVAEEATTRDMTTDGLHESDENVNIGNDKENK